MYIAFVTQVDLTGSSGQNLYSRAVATALADHKRVQMTLICPSPANDPVEPMERDDVTVRLIPEKSTRSVQWHLKSQFPILKSLYYTHKDANLDGIVTTLKVSNIGPAAFSFLSQVPMILLVEGLLVENIKKINPFPGAPALAQTVAMLNGAQSWHIFTAYEQIKDWMGNILGVNPEKISVFHHGVDPDLFKSVAKAEAREKIPLNISGDEFVVGFVGSFKPYHCLEPLLRAVSELKNRGLNARLLLVGDGPKYDEMIELASKLEISNITDFVGYIDQKLIPNYVCACDILYGVIDPEHWGHPMKVYEYLSCGRPVIAYNDSELLFIEENEIGLLVNKISTTAIADTLAKFSEYSSQTREKMGYTAREYICTHQTWDTYADDIVNNFY